MNPFLTKSKKSDDRHVQRIRHRHGRRSYLSVGVGGDSQSILEREPIRSKDKGLLSYNIDSKHNAYLKSGVRINVDGVSNPSGLEKVTGISLECTIDYFIANFS